MFVGYARVSTDSQDPASKIAILGLDVVQPENIESDNGLTGRDRERPGLKASVTPSRADIAVVGAKLCLLARPRPDARDLTKHLTRRGAKLNVGGPIYDWTAPAGWQVLNVLSMIAQFESERIRTRERTKIEIAKVRMRSEDETVAHSGTSSRDASSRQRPLWDSLGDSLSGRRPTPISNATTLALPRAE